MWAGEHFFGASYLKKIIGGRAAETRTDEERNRDRAIKKRLHGERSWFKQGIRSYQQKEFEIILLLSRKYSVHLLCGVMGVNRSGYYGWKHRQIHKPGWVVRRENNIELVRGVHIDHPSHGYVWIAAYLKQSLGVILSDQYVYRCCRFSGIKSQSRRIQTRKIREEKVISPNRINGRWETTRPYEVVVSDMTCFYHKGTLYELTLYVDTFNNEILSYRLSSRRGDRMTYFDGIKDVIQRIKKEQTSQVTVLHTDQGAVYSSRSFNELLSQYNIIHSMSRAGTPTDNPIIESLNGWMKEEMFLDFQLRKADDINVFIKRYMHWFNNERPAYSLKYKTPVQYRMERGFY